MSKDSSVENNTYDTKEFQDGSSKDAYSQKPLVKLNLT